MVLPSDGPLSGLLYPLGSILYDALRPAIVQLTSLDALCELVDVLKVSARPQSLSNHLLLSRPPRSPSPCANLVAICDRCRLFDFPLPPIQGNLSTENPGIGSAGDPRVAEADPPGSSTSTTTSQVDPGTLALRASILRITRDLQERLTFRAQVCASWASLLFDNGSSTCSYKSRGRCSFVVPFARAFVACVDLGVSLLPGETSRLLCRVLLSNPSPDLYSRGHYWLPCTTGRPGLPGCSRAGPTNHRWPP